MSMKTRKKHQMLALFMAIAMVISSLQFSTATVKAEEALSPAMNIELENSGGGEFYASGGLYDPVTDEDLVDGTVDISQITAVTSAAVTVGQIVYKYGNNGSINSTIIQDVVGGEIYGIQIYGAVSNYEVGDIVKVSGAVSEYGKVLQFSSGSTVEKIRSGSQPFAPQEVTLTDLKTNPAAYISEYIKIKDVTLGAYNASNTAIRDSTGNTLNIYKSAAFPEGVEEGSKVDVLGVYSRYNTTYQLRNGLSENSFIGDTVVDKSVTLPIAKWAGTAQVTATEVYGDLLAENDRSDTNAKITLSTGGNPTYNASSGAMGSQGLSQGQYYQMELNTEKLGNITLSFDMRGSNTGAKYFNVLCSADDITYEKINTISYSYTTKNYNTNVETKVEKKDVDKLEVITSQVSYQMTLPAALANLSTAYVRIQVADDSTAINDSSIGAQGVNRFLNVAVTGCPLVSDSICGFVKALPAAGSAMKGQELTLTSDTADAVIYYSFGNGSRFSVYDASSKPVLDALPASVITYAEKGGLADSVKITYDYTQEKVSTPKLSPNGGSVMAGTEVKISTETEGAQIQYSVDGGKNWNTYTEKIKLETFPVTITTKAVKTGFLDSEEKTVTFTERLNEDYKVYFGQIHSHTSYSDGAGSCDDAFKYASEEAEQIDFLAVTDHSNSFDNDTSVTIKDGSASAEWVEGHQLADQYTSSSFVGIYGYEMTWSGGAPGHMNTFNTAGFLSRNMDGYKNGSASSLPNYYTQLKTVTDSISQFNHPGTTFGDFYDFGYYDREVDQLITTIEVGNGEGAIGSSGYFPSYEYYTRALDKGWHVAPTNNQDNHKGKWGDSNTARTVVLADDLTRDNIYDALRNMRTYSTEDNNLEIQYTLNNAPMGSIFEEKPEAVNIAVKLRDGDNEGIGRVEVIVNGGLSVADKSVSGNEEIVNFKLGADYSYYYIRVTQKDGDIAVTAPVWISEVESLGVSAIKTGSSLQVKNEEIDITTTLYNNEEDDFKVSSMVYTIDDEVIHTVDLNSNAQMKSVAFGETPSYTFYYTHDGLGSTNIYVTVTGTLNGIEKIYKDVLQLKYIDPSMVTRVIVDGTHNNDYVTGYYGGNVGNFADIAAGDNVQVSIETTEITREMLEDCKLLVISAPAKKTGTYNDKSYGVSHFEASFIEMVADYVENGGNVILCGLADYQDSASAQSSTEINSLLEAMGATTRLNSDELVDDDNNGGQNFRLYFTKFNTESEYMEGIVAEETCSTYSAYSACGILLDSAAVAAGKAEALVYGHDTTYSIDSRSYDSNYVEQEKGSVVALAHETIGDKGGEVFVGGTVFVSDFEVKAELDYAGELTYANRLILLNILSKNKMRIDKTDIADVRKAAMGDAFAIEGYVTAGTAVEGNIFFDTIYVQDDTAGITVFPMADAGIEVGQKIRVEGFVDAYQGDKELQIISYELLEGEKKIYAPKVVTTKEAADYEANGGRLVQVTGKVTRVEIAAGDLKYIYVVDDSGVEAVVFTDGYITASNGYTGLMNDVKVGSTITAVGLVYMNPDGTVMRVRDRAEIKIHGKGGSSGSSSPASNVPVVVPAEPTDTGKNVTVDLGATAKVEMAGKAIEGNLYSDGFFYTDNGQKITNSIVERGNGDRYIVDANGYKYTSTTVRTANGNRYIVNQEGLVIRGAIVNTGKYSYYTTKGTGKVVANKVFKLNGKKYVATKTGKIVTSKWFTVGNKKYYCNKNGVVTKTKPVKK